MATVRSFRAESNETAYFKILMIDGPNALIGARWAHPNDFGICIVSALILIGARWAHLFNHYDFDICIVSALVLIGARWAHLFNFNDFDICIVSALILIGASWAYLFNHFDICILFCPHGRQMSIPFQSLWYLYCIWPPAAPDELFFQSLRFWYRYCILPSSAPGKLTFSIIINFIYELHFPLLG